MTSLLAHVSVLSLLALMTVAHGALMMGLGAQPAVRTHPTPPAPDSPPKYAGLWSVGV